MNGVLGESADLDWKAGDVPIARRFDDPYFSLEDGLAESRHVFLGGNNLPTRFRDGFHIAELGFGSGLNALACIQAWQACNLRGRFRFTSFEAFPLDPDDMARALAPWPELADQARILIAAWRRGARRFEIGPAEISVLLGDARERLPGWIGRADAWFLDGFSPSKNPELWEAGLLNDVARHTATEGTCATYSAAGHVREKLAAAGFTVTRLPGFRGKRHMTRGVLAPCPQPALATMSPDVT